VLRTRLDERPHGAPLLAPAPRRLSHLASTSTAPRDFSFGLTGFESSSDGVVAAWGTNQKSRPRAGGGWWRSRAVFRNGLARASAMRRSRRLYPWPAFRSELY
jgi:hypothetical protein